MKTRNEIYQGEGAKLLRFITTYHTLRYDQVLQLFSRHEQSIKSLITSLIKQGRIIYDKEHDLLCDSQQSAENPDYAIITCFWVLLDFKKGVVYHTSGEFPIKLNFFSQDEQYEIIYIGEEADYDFESMLEKLQDQTDEPIDEVFELPGISEERKSEIKEELDELKRKMIEEFLDGELFRYNNWENEFFDEDFGLTSKAIKFLIDKFGDVEY